MVGMLFCCTVFLTVRRCGRVRGVCRVSFLVSSFALLSCFVVAPASQVQASEPYRDDRGAVGKPLDELAGAEKLNTLIERVVTQQRSLRSLQATFTQVKQSDLLLEPAVTHGRFTFLAPDRVRWDYVTPQNMVVAFADDMVTTFFPDQNRAECVKISRRNRRFVRVLAGTQPLDDLRKNFSFALSDEGRGKPYKLTLEPIHRVLRNKLASVVLEVDRKLLLPTVIEYLAADGDRTRYEFSDLVLNPSIKPSEFELSFGEDVQLQTVDMGSADD